MSTIKRRSRQRLATPESLADYWDRQLPPPDWAYEPGEHRQELIELVFFGSDLDWRAQDHPYRREWGDAMTASKPSA